MHFLDKMKRENKILYLVENEDKVFEKYMGINSQLAVENLSNQKRESLENEARKIEEKYTNFKGTLYGNLLGLGPMESVEEEISRRMDLCHKKIDCENRLRMYNEYKVNLHKDLKRGFIPEEDSLQVNDLVDNLNTLIKRDEKRYGGLIQTIQQLNVGGNK